VSALVARILLAMFVVPLGALVYLTTLFGMSNRDHVGDRISDWFIAGAITWAFVAVYWSAIWRSIVARTTERRAATWGLAVAAILAAGFIGFILTPVDPAAGVPVATILAPLLWLMGTTFVWRETFRERGARLGRSGPGALLCPGCGYNLTGLTEARCPECGKQFTLDQLFAAQPSSAHAELYD
jgi:hypothetical protein